MVNTGYERIAEASWTVVILPRGLWGTSTKWSYKTGNFARLMELSEK
jgi:hypothetical protein